MPDRIGGPHPCLYSGCEVTVPESQLTCDEHWADVPRDLRLEMVDAYALLGDKSPEYNAAVQAVVDWLTLESQRHRAVTELFHRKLAP